MAWWDENLHDRRVGDYQLDEKLGQGGMAEVFRAVIVEGRGRGLTVAIKLPNLGKFPPDDLPLVFRRFEREVELQRSEPIPNIVKMLDAGEVMDKRGVKRPYLVMEYLAGGNLGSKLGGPPGKRQHIQTISEVMRWLAPVAGALDALHASTPPRLHRDVKPENILFNTMGAPYLSDFGIATTLATGLDAVSRLTGSGIGSPGSPGYQSPEAQCGENLVASDQFSLAVTVYEALSGKLPFDGSTTSALYAAISRWKVVDLKVRCPELPDSIADAVMKGMAEKPEDRYGSCVELAKAIEKVTDSATPGKEEASAKTGGSERTTSENTPPSGDKKRPPKPSRTWGVGAAALALVLLGLGSWIFTSLQEKSDQSASGNSGSTDRTPVVGGSGANKAAPVSPHVPDKLSNSGANGTSVPAPLAYGGTTDGKVIFENLCQVCHTNAATGAATGAPAITDKTAWAPRIAQGFDTLLKHAIDGFAGHDGLMPQRGGNPDLSDQQIEASVKYIVSQVKRPKEAAPYLAKKTTEQESAAQRFERDGVQDNHASGINWRWPSSGELIGTFIGSDHTKQGIDIAGSAGDPVSTAADGQVVYSGNGLGGYGELIIVKHDANFLSYYGHNRKRLVSEGEKVRAGQQIAEMGSSGAARVALRFEIRKKGNPVNPVEYLPVR